MPKFSFKVQVGSTPLEKEMAVHSGILAGKVPWTEEPGSLSSMGLKKSDTTEQRSIGSN